MNNKLRFIVIDDDPLNNTICRLTIKKALGEVDVVTFTDPHEGFEYVGTSFNGGNDHSPAVLFLDINMPIMNGWEFLERYENLEYHVKEHIRLFIVSSSVDSKDVERASINKNVIKYLPKPVTKEIITTLVY